MKTLKFVLIAAIVACTMVSFANADGFKEKPKAMKVITLTIEKALTVPGLPLAMYQQIDPEDLLDSPSAILEAKVILNSTQYRIRGTREQWIKFFQWEGNLPFSTAKGFGTN